MPEAWVGDPPPAPALLGPFMRSSIGPRSQSFSKIYIHATFSTKGRIPIIADPWRDELFKVLGGTANDLGCPSSGTCGASDLGYKNAPFGVGTRPSVQLRTFAHDALNEP